MNIKKNKPLFGFTHKKFKQIIKKVAQKANQDQLALAKKYDRQNSVK